MVVKFTNEVFRQSRTCLHRTTAVLGLRKAGMAVRIRLEALLRNQLNENLFVNGISTNRGILLVGYYPIR